MASKLATLVCLAFIAYLFRSDLKRNNGPSAALWIPFFWMFLAGSRWVSSWLNLSPPLDSVDSYSEGSPVDRTVFLALIVAGGVVLARRNLDWRRWIASNPWIALYLMYCLASMAWSDEPFVLFKRWIKDLGNPIMALVILTDRRPYETAATILRRLSFLLLPLSLLFVKYFPDLGRVYHIDGAPLYTGIGHQKNDLGGMCLITGIYFAWNLIVNRSPDWKSSPVYTRQDMVLVVMMAWLLYMSNSQTSLACLVVASGLFVLSRFPPFSRKPAKLVIFLTGSALVFGILEQTFHIKDYIFYLLGRDPSLTNRTELWALVKSLETNPLLGAGFMSFWAGERMARVWEVMGRGVNQAHSGYLEQYLNLGYVGLAFIGGIILAGLISVRRQLDTDVAGGLLRFSFILVAILYNYTEASFYGINTLWMLLLIGCITIPGYGAATVTAAVAAPSAGRPMRVPMTRYRRPRPAPGDQPSS
jgi:O-antigen ligase